MQDRQNSGLGNQKKSSLYAKSESKIYQLNVPVELDLDFQQRLKAKDQLLSELSSRNFTDVNVDQLERDYFHMTELNRRKNALERQQKTEITEKILYLKTEQNASSDPRERVGIDVDMSKLRETGRLLKKQIKEILSELRDIEEKVILTALKLPNELHASTPLSQDRVEDSGGTEDCHTDRLSHIEIGQMFDLIKFSNIGSKAYYFKDSLALLEQALTNYFSERLRQEGFTQMASPELFKDLVVEGCGEDSDSCEQFLKLKPKADDISDSFLTGVSIMSFAAYLAKSRINKSCLPLQYFTCGRSYLPGAKSSLPGLFDATQSVKINMFSVVGEPEECDVVTQTIKNYLCDIYKQFDVPWRAVTVCAPRLHKTEELRIEIQMWVKSIQKYIKVASVSMVSDYISRRLMIRHGKLSLPVYMVHCEALDVTRLIAILMEYGTIKEDTYTLPPLDFLDNYWIQPTVRSN